MNETLSEITLESKQQQRFIASISLNSFVFILFTFRTTNLFHSKYDDDIQTENIKHNSLMVYLT